MEWTGDLDKLYDEAIENFIENNSIILIDTEENIGHVKDIIKSILFTRDEIQKGGSFVHAIIENNLEKAVAYADSTCIRYLREFVMAKNYIWIKT